MADLIREITVERAADVRSLLGDRDMVVVRPDTYSVGRSLKKSYGLPAFEDDIYKIFDVVLGFKEAEG